MKTAYFFGYGGNSVLLNPLKPILEKTNFKLVSIHEWDNADIKWNRHTWISELKKADIIILPANFSEQSAKSNNRLTQALSLGKPVICSPLDAYVRIEKNFPGCCLIANNLEEWETHLNSLQKNENICKELSRKGLEVAKNYSLNVITNKWISLFKIFEKIDIIIPTYNNIEYLKLCIESIKKNTNNPYNLIISDAGSNEETWNYYRTLTDVKILGNLKQRLNFSQSCNNAIKISNSKYFVILNSDVIVSKNWDSNIIKNFELNSNLAVCGVLSNCDRGWLHGINGKPSYEMKIKNLELVPGMKIEQIEGNLESLYSFMENSNKQLYNKFLKQEWVAYYACVFNRKIIEEVGFLDPNFINGCEDLDHCIRIKKMGFEIGQAIDSFVFHFGGISRAAYQREF